MAGERRGGMEITSSKSVPPGPVKARPPGEVLFDLVFSNESLWSTVDPHAAQNLVEKSIQLKGVVDLGDVLRELLDRKTKPDLAKGVVLAFAMDLARMSVAIRLPSELQSLDRTARQKLVDVFRAGQKAPDEPTRTLAQPGQSGQGRASSPPRPAPQKTASGAPPSSSKSTAPPRAAQGSPSNDDALAGWSQGLGAASDPKSSKSSGPSRAASETSGLQKAPRGPAEQTRERSRTAIERPRPSREGIALSGIFTPGRMGAAGAAVLFFVIGVLVGPRGAPVVSETTPLPPFIPCQQLDKNGDQHLICVVDLENVPTTLTLDELISHKAKMLEAARRRGMVSVTYLNPDLTRFDPALAPARIEAQRREARVESGAPAATPSRSIFTSQPRSDDDDDDTQPPPTVETAPTEPLITDVNEDGTPRSREVVEEVIDEGPDTGKVHVERAVRKAPSSGKKTGRTRGR